MKAYIYTAVFVILVIIGAFFLRITILGGQEKNQSTISLQDSVEKSLASSSAYRNVDFKLKNVLVSSDKQWAAAEIVPKEKLAADSDVVIFKRVDGVLQLFMGPGSNFPPSATKGLPDDIINYLRDLGALGSESTIRR